MSFTDNYTAQQQPGQAGGGVFNQQLQALYRSLMNKPLTAQEQQAGQQGAGQQPLTGGGNPQQGQAGGGAQFSALGTAAGAAAPAVKSLMQSLKGGGSWQDPGDNVAGGPDEGTADSADVAGGPDIAPADSGSMSSSFFSGLNGS